MSAGGAAQKIWATIEGDAQHLFSTVDVLYTKRRGHAMDLAEGAARDGVDAVVAIGGDGTISEVVNGLLRAGSGTSDVPLGIIPAGTGGDTVRTLGIPRDPRSALLCVAHGRRRRIDAGCVTFDPRGSRRRQRFFLNVADAGLGGDTVAAVDGLKRLGGRLGFLLGTLGALARFRPAKVRIQIDGGADDWTGVVDVVACGNCRFFGGGMQIAPRADPADGLLELVVVDHRPPWKSIPGLRRLYDGTVLEDPAVRYRRVRSAEVTADRDDVRVDVDGEFPGMLPARFEVLPGALEVLV